MYNAVKTCDIVPIKIGREKDRLVGKGFTRWRWMESYIWVRAVK